MEEGGEEWRRVGRSGGKNVLLLTDLSIFGSSSLSNRASISLTLTCISHFFMKDNSHFHISTPPPLPTLIQLALFTLSSLILLSSPTSPLPWFPFLSHSTTRAHELKTSKACPNNTLDVTADSCTEIRH